MRPIQNNLANLQMNQIAMEQAALQAANNKQADRVRAETAEEILKQQREMAPKKNSSSNQDGKGNTQNFKNLLYSKEGAVKNDSNEPLPENTVPIQITHIDFKV